jgi:ABC-type Na+ efflux pump permease subunit
VTQNSAFSRMCCLSQPTTLFLPILMLWVALISGSPLNAQVQTGVDGAVTDSSGAVIQGAQISVANSQTGVVAKAVSSSSGAFNVIGLIPGDYNITVEAPGFKTFKTQLTVEVAKVSGVNHVGNCFGKRSRHFPEHHLTGHRHNRRARVDQERSH